MTDVTDLVYDMSSILETSCQWSCEDATALQDMLDAGLDVPDTKKLCLSSVRPVHMLTAVSDLIKAGTVHKSLAASYAITEFEGDESNKRSLIAQLASSDVHLSTRTG